MIAALLWDNDSFMICQRPIHKARGLLWGGGRQGGARRNRGTVADPGVSKGPAPKFLHSNNGKAFDYGAEPSSKKGSAMLSHSFGR